jgi:NarL family two-component system response regulator LiaR
MGQHIRVLIADDHPKSRRGLRALLSTCPVVEVVCEAENGQEAARLVEEYRPDVVLMDIQMPVWDGLEATRYIKARWPEVEVIALTIHPSWQEAALSAGADLFLLKGCPSKELFAAVQCGKRIQPEIESVRARPQSDTSSIEMEKPRPIRLATALTG